MPNLIVDLAFNFSSKISDFAVELESKSKFSMATRLFNSGISIRSNVCDAQASSVKNDFEHKCKLAFKEAKETEYWLKLCKHSENYPAAQYMLDDIRVIIKMLGKMITPDITT